MMDWQPIETAPKDGTPILVCGGQDDNFIYAPDKYMMRMKAPSRAWWEGDGWIVTLTEACCSAVSYKNPTHWMPLPEPPENP